MSSDTQLIEYREKLEDGILHSITVTPEISQFLHSLSDDEAFNIHVLKLILTPGVYLRGSIVRKNDLHVIVLDARPCQGMVFGIQAQTATECLLRASVGGCWMISWILPDQKKPKEVYQLFTAINLLTERLKVEPLKKLETAAAGYITVEWIAENGKCLRLE